MAILYFLIELFGAVYLLLFGIKTVQSGVERSFGQELRSFLLKSHHQSTYTFIGICLALAFQSGTAASILAINFVSAGFMRASAALATVIGADFGSSLSALILSFNLAFLMPLLLFLGGWAYLKSQHYWVKYIGKIIFGIALILISLQLLKHTMQPVSESGVVLNFSQFLNRDLVTTFILGAALALVLHSSIAALLIGNVAVLSGALGMEAGLAYVFGVNFGASLILIWILRKTERKARAVAIANFALRGFLALICLSLLVIIGLPNDIGFGLSIILVHVAFNAVLLLFSFASPWLIERTNTFIPEASEDKIAQTPNLLDRSVLGQPNLALLSTRRELLHMSEVIQTMAQPIMKLYENFDEKTAQHILQSDLLLNDSLSQIRNYVAEIPYDQMRKSERRTARRLVDLAIDLEAAGDVISKRLVRYARIVRDENAQFSDAGRKEIENFFARVQSNLQKNFSLILSEDPDLAEAIIEEKSRLRNLEAKSRRAHFKRLQSHEFVSFGSSDMHLETLSALRELNSKTSAFAYSILEANNQLLETRIKPG